MADRFTGSGPYEDREWEAWADALKPGDRVRHEAGMVGEVVDFADRGVVVRYGGGDVVWPWDRVWPVNDPTAARTALVRAALAWHDVAKHGDDGPALHAWGRLVEAIKAAKAAGVTG